jgi:KDO2-lipid IV(A) lauroyltransferase
MSRAAARLAAPIGYYVIPRVRTVGLANLSLAYGDSLTLAEKKRILKKAVENVGLVAAEFPYIPRLKRDFFDTHVTVKGIEHVAPGRGTIAIGAHLGNWEWMGPAMANRGYRVAAIVRPLADPRLNAFVDRTRCSGNIRTIPKDKAGRVILELLRDGWVVGIMVDQSPRDSAAPVRFFNQPCWATTGAALAAMRSHAPVVPVAMTRSENDCYTIEIFPEIPMERSGDLWRDLITNAQRCQDAIETLVRRCPEQWLWFHRRWKPRPRLEQKWREKLGDGAGGENFE